MNVLHMKYVVEVAQCGSLNKASERLLIAPPNLSRCIKGQGQGDTKVFPAPGFLRALPYQPRVILFHHPGRTY